MNPFTPRPPRPPGPYGALAFALLVAVSLSACGGTDQDRNQAARTSEPSTSAPSPDPSSASDEQDAGASDGTPIRIIFGDTELTARLHGNATARDLAAQLPLTLTFRDHNNVEKTARLPRELSLNGAPAEHDPAAGNICYYAPGSDFVLYYDNDAPYFDGILRIGEVHGDVQAITRLPEDSSATIERAE